MRVIQVICLTIMAKRIPKPEPKEVVIGGKVGISLARKVDAEAAAKGVSRSAILRWALIKYFESNKNAA